LNIRTKIRNTVLAAVVCFFIWIGLMAVFYGEAGRTITKLGAVDIVAIAIYIGAVVYIFTRDYKKAYDAKIQKALTLCNIIVPPQHEYTDKSNARSLRFVEPFRYNSDLFFFVINYQNELLYKIVPELTAVNRCAVCDPYDNQVGAIAFRYDECTVEVFDRATFFKIKIASSFRMLKDFVGNISTKGWQDSYTDTSSSAIQFEGLPLIYRSVLNEDKSNMDQQLISPNNEILACSKFSPENYGWNKNPKHDIELYNSDIRLELLFAFAALRIVKKYNDSKSDST